MQVGEPESAGAPASGSRSVRSGVTLAAKILVSVALLAFLATRVDLAATGRAIVRSHVPTLGIALALFVGSNVLGAVQWATLLRASGLSISLTRVTAYYFQGSFFGLFLPASVGADVSRVYDTTRHTGRLGGAVAATVMDRLVGFYSISMFAIVAVVLGGREQRPPLAILVPIVVFAGVNLVVCLSLFSTRVSAFLVRWAGRLPDRPRTVATGLVEALHGLGRRPGLLLGVIGLSILVQVLRVTVHYHVAAAMGISLPLREFFVIIPVLAVLVALPISFGGIGVRESAAVQLFGHVGLPATDAVAMQVTAFALSILASLPGWFVFVARQVRYRRIGGRGARAAGIRATDGSVTEPGEMG